MRTHTVEITVGGPAYGFPFTAYAKSETARWLNACVGTGDSPEAAATDAVRSVELDAGRCGYVASPPRSRSPSTVPASPAPSRCARRRSGRGAGASKAGLARTMWT